MAKAGGTSWFKYGCFGCLGLVALVILIIAGLSAVAWQKAQSQEVQEKVLTREVPGPETAEQRRAEEATAEITERRSPEGPGRVFVDVRNVAFYVEPADPGEPLRIEAKYDVNGYVLEEGFDEQDAGSPWTYRIRFQRQGNQLLSVLARLFGGTEPELRVFLPREEPLALDLLVREGRGQVQLGVLWLTSADIEFARGGLAVDVDGPLQEPMDELSIHGQMGGFNASHLGNASPKRLDVDYRMGGMNLDLSGKWIADADVSLSWEMGGGSVTLPSNVVLQGIDGKSGAEPGGEVPPPTLSFRLSGDMDDMKFVTRDR